MSRPSENRVGPEVQPTQKSVGWLTRGTLPPDLLESAHRRLRLLTLLTIVSIAIALPFMFTGKFQAFTRTMVIEPLALALPLLTFAGVLFGLSFVKRFPPARLLDLALLFEVMVALGIALGRHALPWTDAHTRDISEVAVWILIFAVLIPSTPWKTALAALLAAAMDPLGLAIAVHYGVPMPTSKLLGPMFGPTVGSVVIAIILSRFLFRMGRRMQRVREEAKELGSYRLRRKLGSGGMGEVWLAEHRMLKRPAAIKLIPEELLRAGTGADARTVQQRFEREARATALLQSEHTVELYDYGVTDDGTCYYVMEHLYGLDTEQLVDRFGSLPPERVVHLLLGACESLSEAHAAGLVHRDIKPANLYVCKKGPRGDVVKVLDFGLVRRTEATGAVEARLTVEGHIAGTPAFMAPEAALGGDEVDGRSDLYALGCVAWWMLTGRMVFPEKTAVKQLFAHINSPPPDLAPLCEHPLPEGLEAVLRDCLAKDPDDRPQTADALAERLRAIALEQPWTAERIHRWWDTHRAEIASADDPEPAAQSGVVVTRLDRPSPIPDD